MKELILHPEARAEMASAIVWYDNERPGLGSEFNEAVDAVLDQIEASPDRGWRYGNEGHRVLPTARFPYLIYYLEADDKIWISAIAHERRQPDYWQHRKLS